MKSFFITTNSHKDRGGHCACVNTCKIELQAADGSLDFLASHGFADHDTLPGSCSMCGKPYAFRRLVVNSVADLRTNGERPA